MKFFSQVSTKKLAGFICVITVIAVSASFAATQIISRTSSGLVLNDEYENTADKVTIYGNGITFVNFDKEITLKENLSTIKFYVPSGALTDTLAVEGINTVKIITSEESHPFMEKGDIITVYTEDSVYSGRFIGWDSMLLLEISNGTVMIPGERVTKIILTEAVQTQGPEILVEITTDSPAGRYLLKVSYLMRGPKWKPTYFIDLTSASLQCWANLGNLENWENVTLALVSGGPHVVHNGPILEPYYSPIKKGSASSYVDVSSSNMDEFHEYIYRKKISFEKDTVVKLPLFNGTVGLRQEYYWSSGEVQNRYHINNTLNEPLASGTVEFYRGEAWIGEDNIGYTPIDGESIALVNYAYDIKITSTVTKSIREYHHENRGTNITVRNYKSTSVQILIQQDIDGYTLVASEPIAERMGSTLTWLVDVEAGGKAEIYYEWDHNW